MTVAVATAVVAFEGSRVNVTAGNLTLTADGTNPRFYLIVASSAGVKSAVAGTPAPEMGPGVRGPVFPAIPASSVVLASVYVPAADTDIDANQIDDMRVLVVPPEPTTNYDLAKARSIPLVKERSQTVTLDTGQNLVHALLIANGKLFATTLTTPTQLIRCNNLEDLTDRTAITFAADGFHDESPSAVYVADTNRIYVMFQHASRTTIAEVNPDTLATTDVISDTSRPSGTAGIGGSICSDGTNLYVTTATSPTVVNKYRLSDFAFVAGAILTGLDGGHACLYDGTDVFVTGGVAEELIARVNPTDMTFVTGSLPAGTYTDDMASIGDHLWVGRESSSNINLVRVEKANLGTNQLVGTSFNTIWGLHYDGRYLWVVHSGASEVSRVDPVSLDVVVVNTVIGGNEIVSDGAGRLFMTTFASPSQVKRMYAPVFAARRFGLAPDLPVGGSIDTVKPMGKRFIDSATRATSGTSEGTLGQMTVSGNQLNVDGMMMRITVSGTFAANANNKRIAIRLGSGNYMFDTGLLPFNDVRWKFICEITRTGAATQDWSAFFISDSSVMATDVQNSTAAADLSVLQFLAVRGESPSAAGEVVQEQMWVEVIS